MQKLTIGTKTVDTSLIGYVDLDYRAPGGTSRVLVAMAEDREQLAQQNFQRIFFADRDAEELKAYFTRPENRHADFVVFTN